MSLNNILRSLNPCNYSQTLLQEGVSGYVRPVFYGNVLIALILPWFVYIYVCDLSSMFDRYASILEVKDVSIFCCCGRRSRNKVFCYMVLLIHCLFSVQNKTLQEVLLYQLQCVKHNQSRKYLKTELHQCLVLFMIALYKCLYLVSY